MGDDEHDRLLGGRPAHRDNWATAVTEKLAGLRAQPEVPPKIEKMKIYCILIRTAGLSNDPNDCDIFFSCTEGNMINENTYTDKLQETKRRVGQDILEVREVVFEVPMQVSQLFGPVTLSATAIEDK